MNVLENFSNVLEIIETTARRVGRKFSDVKMIAVTKAHPLEHVLPVYHAGCRDFGENRVLEGIEKIEKAPKEIHWHFIGNLQSNKVKKAVDNYQMIHSVSSPRLATLISDYSLTKNKKTDILLEVNCSGEVTKQGLTPKSWIEEFEGLLSLEGVSIQGLMTMAPYTEDRDLIRRCFSDLRHLRDTLKGMNGSHAPLNHLSMGMSNDYTIAIEEGATLLRIGSALFGNS